MMIQPKAEYNLACREILELLRSELSMNGCFLYHQQGDVSFVEFVSGSIPKLIEGQTLPSLNVIADAVHTGRCAPIVPDVSQSAYSELDVYQDFSPTSIVAIPICKTDENNFSLLCGISLSNVSRNLITRNPLLEFCARQIEQSIDRYFNNTDRINEINLLTEQAHRDVLTGILNRNGWENVVATTIHCEFELHQYVSVFVIDVNDLKSINDTQGHAVGDATIRQVADVLQEFFKPQSENPTNNGESLVARTGGDEFIGMLFSCDDESANSVIDDIYAKLSENGISVAIGSSCCRSIRKLPDAIVNADEAMYLQKKLTKAERTAAIVDLKIVS